jgi:hypothetical protein
MSSPTVKIVLSSKGGLTKYGYKVASPELTRHRALSRAIRGLQYGNGMSRRVALGKMIRRINVLIIYRKNPRSTKELLARRRLRRDMRWLRDKLREIK